MSFQAWKKLNYNFHDFPGSVRILQLVGVKLYPTMDKLFSLSSMSTYHNAANSIIADKRHNSSSSRVSVPNQQYMTSRQQTPFVVAIHSRINNKLLNNVTVLSR